MVNSSEISKTAQFVISECYNEYFFVENSERKPYKSPTKNDLNASINKSYFSEKKENKKKPMEKKEKISL